MPHQRAAGIRPLHALARWFPQGQHEPRQTSTAQQQRTHSCLLTYLRLSTSLLPHRTSTFELDFCSTAPSLLVTFELRLFGKAKSICICDIRIRLARTLRYQTTTIFKMSSSNATVAQRYVSQHFHIPYAVLHSIEHPTSQHPSTDTPPAFKKNSWT
jgi:hypothetical protein